MGLAILSNALDLVESGRSVADNGENIVIDMTGIFWELVTEDLLHNVQKALEKPNEGAVSAKCIRCLTSLSNKIPDMLVPASLGPRGLRACLSQARRFGARHHWMLEQESQKLLDTYC